VTRSCLAATHDNLRPARGSPDGVCCPTARGRHDLGEIRAHAQLHARAGPGQSTTFGYRPASPANSRCHAQQQGLHADYAEDEGLRLVRWRSSLWNHSWNEPQHTAAQPRHSGAAEVPGRALETPPDHPVARPPEAVAQVRILPGAPRVDQRSSRRVIHRPAAVD